MDPSDSTMAQQIAHAASTFERQRTGRTPQAVSVVLGEETLVVTLHGALSPAEMALACSPEGAARIQEFHRQLFATSCGPLCEEIKRITGVAVREAAAEIEPATGTVVRVFNSGTVVQVYLLAHGVPPGQWSETGNANLSAQSAKGENAETGWRAYLHGETKGGTDRRDTGGEG